MRSAPKLQQQYRRSGRLRPRGPAAGSPSYALSRRIQIHFCCRGGATSLKYKEGTFLKNDDEEYMVIINDNGNVVITDGSTAHKNGLFNDSILN